MGREIGWILGEISEDEVVAGRPMLSSVAVGIKGTAGPGFFGLAGDLGRLSKGQEELAFWEAEREAAYLAWKRPLLKAK